MSADAPERGSGAMWYCFAVDPSRTTPRQVNRLWRRRHRGAWHRVLRVREGVSGGRWEPTGPASAWWHRPGAGFVVIVPGEDALDRAVFAFLLEHAELFERLWYGSASRSPLDGEAVGHELAGLLGIDGGAPV